MNNWPEMMVKRVADVIASVKALLAAKEARADEPAVRGEAA